MITLATLPKATEQQVFDQVATHLLKQGKRSVNDIDGCCYRGNNNLKCAAGVLIADNEYVKEMDVSDDGTSWEELVEKKLVPSEHCTLISDLQFLHDSVPPARWEDELIKVALNHGLTYNFPTHA